MNFARTFISNSTTLDKIDEMICILQDKRDQWKRESKISNDEFVEKQFDALVVQTSKTIENLCIMANWLDPEV